MNAPKTLTIAAFTRLVPIPREVISATAIAVMRATGSFVVTLTNALTRPTTVTPMRPAAIQSEALAALAIVGIQGTVLFVTTSMSAPTRPTTAMSTRPVRTYPEALAAPAMMGIRVTGSSVMTSTSVQKIRAAPTRSVPIPKVVTLVRVLAATRATG